MGIWFRSSSHRRWFDDGFGLGSSLRTVELGRLVPGFARCAPLFRDYRRVKLRRLYPTGLSATSCEHGLAARSEYPRSIHRLCYAVSERVETAIWIGSHLPYFA